MVGRHRTWAAIGLEPQGHLQRVIVDRRVKGWGDVPPEANQTPLVGRQAVLQEGWNLGAVG